MKKTSELSPAELATIIRSIPDDDDHGKNRKAGATTVNDSIKVNFLGWLSETKGAGYYGRQKPVGTARLVYQRLKNPTWMLWLAENLGASRTELAEARRRSKAVAGDKVKEAAAVRAAIPWERIEELARAFAEENADRQDDSKPSGQVELELSPFAFALALANEAHAGQFDKAGAPYIEHPLRVMGRLRTDDDLIVALLHDVFEDGDAKYGKIIREVFPAHIVEALEALTKRGTEHGDEGYERFIRRASKNPIARKVKLADLEDNLDVRRLEVLRAADVKRLNKYLAARRYLLKRE